MNSSIPSSFKETEKRIRDILLKYCKKPIVEKEITETDNLLSSKDDLTSVQEKENKEDEEDIEKEEKAEDAEINPNDYYFYYKIMDADDLQSDAEVQHIEESYIKIISKEFIDGKMTRSYKFILITFYDEKLIEYIQEALNSGNAFDAQPYIDINLLFNAIHNLRIDYAKKFNYDFPVLKLLLDFVEDMFKDNIAKMDKMISEGIIDYHSLWYYFDRIHTIYFVKHAIGEKIAFREKYFTYYQSHDDDNKRFELYGDVIYHVDGKYYTSDLKHIIQFFKNTRKVTSFDIILKSEVEYKEHLAYTDKVITLQKSIHHMVLKGNQYITDPHGKIAKIHYENEKVIVDEKHNNKMSLPFELYKVDEVPDINNLSEDDKLIVFPLVVMFNLGLNKRWGACHVKDLVPVEFMVNPLQYLEIPQERKDIIKDLIDNQNILDAADFVADKGKGLTFLLVGTPGLGKSLTAELITYDMKKPLYKVGVSDLGTNPEDMESVLKRTHDNAVRWNANLLIDEIDIFLEDREHSDITRNAMVSTFLNFLEYHNGVIFLTTNRLKSIDHAIKSRINLFLYYTDLNVDKRLNIWKKLIAKCKHYELITIDTYRKLANYKLNGREIRNYVKVIVSVLNKYKDDTNINKLILEKIENFHNLTTEFEAQLPEKKNNMYT